MKAYSQDLREKIVSAMKEGLSRMEVARRFGVCRQTVTEYWNKYLLTGKVETAQIGGYRRSRLEGHDQTLLAWITEDKSLTLAEIQERVLSALDIRIGITALWKRLGKLGLSYKKNSARRRAGQAGGSGGATKVAWAPTAAGCRQAGVH
jgi:transposase